MAEQYTALYPLDRQWEREGRGSPRRGVGIGGPGARAKQIEFFWLFLIHMTGGLGGIWYLFAHGSNGVMWSLFFAGYFVINFGFSVGFHRYFVHRSFECSKGMRYLLGICGQLSALGSVLNWSADHRRHHAFGDRVGDLHSPNLDGHGRPMGKVKGLLVGHIGWIFDNAYTDHDLFAKGLKGEEVVEFCHRTRWWWLGVSYIAFPTLWALAFGGPQDILGCMLVGAGLRNFVFMNGVMGTDSLAHMYGYRRFDDDSTATNNIFIAILTLGDGFHNNHHAQPRAASNQVAWWEFDFNGWTISAMERLGLAWNVQRRKKSRVPLNMGTDPSGTAHRPQLQDA